MHDNDVYYKPNYDGFNYDMVHIETARLRETRVNQTHNYSRDMHARLEKQE